MKKTIILNLSLIFLSISMVNSAEINFNNLSLSEIIKQTIETESISSISAKPQTAEKTSNLSDTKNIKPWTIMVFMNGKNNLASFAAKDLNEMETIGSLPNVNIVVEVGKIAYSAPSYPSYPGYDNPYDPYNPYGPGIHPHWPPMEPYMNREDTNLTTLNKSDTWTGMRRYLMQKDNDTNTVTSPILEKVSGDMGSWEHLAEFGLWAKNKFPAKNYMLIVWNHGDGWKSPNINIDFDKGISSDDETGNKISTVYLGAAEKVSRPLITTITERLQR